MCWNCLLEGTGGWACSMGVTSSSRGDILSLLQEEAADPSGTVRTEAADPSRYEGPAGFDGDFIRDGEGVARRDIAIGLWREINDRESRERNAAQDVPISGIGSTRLFKLRSETCPPRQVPRPLCPQTLPSLLPPDAIATPWCGTASSRKWSIGVGGALSNFYVLPGLFGYDRNTPKNKGDLPKDIGAGRTLLQNPYRIQRYRLDPPWRCAFASC